MSTLLTPPPDPDVSCAFDPLVLVGGVPADARTILERDDEAFLTATSTLADLGIGLSSRYRRTRSGILASHSVRTLEGPRATSINGTVAQGLLGPTTVPALVLEHFHQLRELTEHMVGRLITVHLDGMSDDALARWTIPEASF